MTLSCRRRECTVGFFQFIQQFFVLNVKFFAFLSPRCVFIWKLESIINAHRRLIRDRSYKWRFLDPWWFLIMFQSKVGQFWDLFLFLWLVNFALTLWKTWKFFNLLYPFNVFLSLSLFLLNFLIFSRKQYFKFSPFIIKHLIRLFDLFKLGRLFRKLLLSSFELFSHKNLPLRLHNNCILYFMKCF